MRICLRDFFKLRARTGPQSGKERAEQKKMGLKEPIFYDLNSLPRTERGELPEQLKALNFLATVEKPVRGDAAAIRTADSTPELIGGGFVASLRL